MSAEAAFVLHVIMIGLGATLFMDLWALFLKQAFGILSANYCLVGRWISHMPEGTFVHANIAVALKKPFECAVGWIVHYLVGVVFAFVLAALVSDHWLVRPTVLPALLVGIGTVIVPYFVMHPSFGLGVAASRTPNPTQARLKSLMAHAVFGVGLYVCAVVVSHISPVHT